MEAAQAVLKVLEQHPAFKKLAGGAESDKASSESVLRSLRRNLLAVDGYSQLFFCDEEQKVKAINLKRLQRAEGKEEGPQYQTLRFKPQIDFQICELLFNERSNLLCAVGTHACAAIEISEHVRRELLNDKTKTDEVECKVFPIGDFFHSTNPSISVLRVLWHPFSHSHIAVLTSDNTLRLYDLSVNIDEPEQTLRLYALLPQAVGGASSNSSAYRPPFTAIDFCFGARDVMGWGRFAVYFLMEDGDIYALCPIVPYNCLLPAIVLSDLKATTTAKLKSVTESFRGDEDEENTKQLLYKRYQTQLKWLQAIKGRSVVGSLDEDYIDARNFDRKGRRKRKGIKEGEEAVEGEGGWVLTRQPTSVPAAPVLQGPIDPLDDFNEDGEQVCGLLSIPSTNPLVMARIYMSGVLEIFLSFDDLEAEWNRKDFFLAEESGSESALVLYERLDLNLPVFPLHQVLAGAASPAKKMSKEKRKGYYSDDTSDDEAEDDYLYGSEKQYLSALVPRLSVDPAAKDTLYVRHVAGVHAVKLRWFNRLQGFCANDSAEDPATSLPELQNSETELLLDTMPLKDAKRDLRRNIDPAETLIPGPSFGFEIVNEPLLGHFAIVLTSTFKCLPIRLRGQARGIAALPSFIGGEKEQEKEKEKEADTDKGKEKEKQDKEEKERQEAISRESFYTKIEPLLGKELPRVPLIATPNPSALSYSSPECLAFLIQSCHTLQSGYVLHIHRLNEEIANRVEMMENLKARQSADLSKIQAKVVEQKEHAAAQKRKLEGMKELQASLSNRAQLLLEMVQSQQPVLSTAEKKYHRELREKGAAIQGYKEKIEKLRLQTEKLIQEKNQQQDRRNLSERLVENLKPILAEEMALIGRTVEGVKNLKAEVDKEFPDA